MSLYDNYSKQQNSMYRGSNLSRRHNAGVDEYGEPWEKVTAPIDATRVPELTLNDAFNTGSTSNGLFSDNFQPSQSVLDARGEHYNNYPNAEMSDLNGDSLSGMTDNWSAAGFKDIANGAAGLYGMYQGNKMLGLYEDQIDEAKRNGQVNRDEVTRRNNTRNEWNAALKRA